MSASPSTDGSVRLKPDTTTDSGVRLKPDPIGSLGITVVLMLVAVLLALGLFFAGAAWRARVTSAPIVNGES